MLPKLLPQSDVMQTTALVLMAAGLAGLAVAVLGIVRLRAEAARLAEQADRVAGGCRRAISQSCN